MAERNFIDEFGDIVSREQEVYRQRRVEHEAAALAVETAHLDQMHQKDVEQKKAIKERIKTLNMAWLASQTLLEHGVREQEWFRDVPVVETKGFFRKRDVVVGTRPSIALEGWQFYDFNVIKPQRTNHRFSLAQRATILVLLKDGSVNAVTAWDGYKTKGYDWEPQDVYGIGPKEITPLHNDPMEDGPLRSVWTRLEHPYDDKGEQIGLGRRIPGYKGLRYYSGADGEAATFVAGSHERHLRYNIETRIRKALGALVARSLK